MSPRDAVEVWKPWIDRLERELFPHQECEHEQESFTTEGRKRVAKFLKAFQDDAVRGVLSNPRVTVARPKAPQKAPKR